MRPIDILAIAASAKKEAGRAVKDAMPTIAEMVRAEVAAKEIKTIASIAATIKGDKGDKGDTGPQGEPGLDGAKGDKGDVGPQGLPGRDGKDGKDGANGLNGKDGKPGRDGRDGTGVSDAAVGEDGNLYLALTDGRVIDAGRVKGEDGKDGKDGVLVYSGIGGGGGRSSGDSVAAATQSVFVQDARPTAPGPWVWYRTSGGVLVNVIVNDGL